MTEEEVIAEIERIKNHIKNTNSYYLQRDLKFYLKILQKQLKEMRGKDLNDK